MEKEMTLQDISWETISTAMKMEVCLPSDYLEIFTSYLAKNEKEIDDIVKNEIAEDFKKSKSVLEKSERIIKDTEEIVESVEKVMSTEEISKENRENIAELKKKLQVLVNEISELNKEMFHDELTGCLNRKWIFKKFLENETFFTSNGYAVFIDLNKFKEINDTYGHHIGDLTLQYFANFIKKEILKNDEHLVRYAGDEFIIFTSHPDIYKRVREARKRLSKKILKFKTQKNISFPVNFAFGVEMFEKGKEFSEILKEVDQKMYLDKKRNR